MSDSESITSAPDPDADPQRTLGDLRTTGLLWLINTSVLHPRGYAIALHYDEDGECTGWSIVGDGTEHWQFSCDDETQARINEDFAAIKALLP